MCNGESDLCKGRKEAEVGAAVATASVWNGAAVHAVGVVNQYRSSLLLAMLCSDSLGQPLPVAAAANEMFKAARAKGRGDEDFAAVYEATQQ